MEPAAASSTLRWSFCWCLVALGNIGLVFCRKQISSKYGGGSNPRASINLLVLIDWRPMYCVQDGHCLSLMSDASVYPASAALIPARRRIWPFSSISGAKRGKFILSFAQQVEIVAFSFVLGFCSLFFFCCAIGLSLFFIPSLYNPILGSFRAEGETEHVAVFP